MPTTSASAMFLMRMVGHPLRHRLGWIDLGIPGHENEERKVHNSKEASRIGVGRRDVLKTQISESDEAHGERKEEGLVDPTAIADRLDLRAIEPRQEHERDHCQSHEHDTEEL